MSNETQVFSVYEVVTWVFQNEEWYGSQFLSEEISILSICVKLLADNGDIIGASLRRWEQHWRFQIFTFLYIFLWDNGYPYRKIQQKLDSELCRENPSETLPSTDEGNVRLSNHIVGVHGRVTDEHATREILSHGENAPTEEAEAYPKQERLWRHMATRQSREENGSEKR